MSQFVQWSNFSKIAPYAELFRQGIVVTVLLSVFTVAIGFCIALILALMRMSNVRPFRALGLDKDGHMREGGPLVWISRFNPLSFLATAYVEILRSTPVIRCLSSTTVCLALSSFRLSRFSDLSSSVVSSRVLWPWA